MGSQFWAVVLLCCAVLWLSAAPPSPPWSRWWPFGLALLALVLWCVRTSL